MSSSDLQLDWLRAFVAVVDAGSLTAAAGQVFRSQSSVSMQIKKLEDVVGSPLLLRGPRHLKLTPTGAELLGYARRMLELNEEALATLKAPELTGRVSLGVPDDYAMAYLTTVLRTFSSRFTGVEVTLVCEQSTALIPKIENGELDLAVVTRDHGRRGTLLMREPLVWVGAEESGVWRRDPLPIAVHELGSRVRSTVLAAIAKQNRAYRIVYHSPNVAGQLAAAHSGMAVAVLTRCSLPSDLMVLNAKHGLPPLPDLDVALIRSKHSQHSPAVVAMYDQIVSSLKRAQASGSNSQ